jgi:hypothetical protein
MRFSRNAVALFRKQLRKSIAKALRIPLFDGDVCIKNYSQMRDEFLITEELRLAMNAAYTSLVLE